MTGGKVGFSRGDVKLLPEDIKALQPTVFPSVPRLLNRVYDKVMSEASSSAITKFLLNFAVKMKAKELNEYGSILDAVLLEE